MDMPTWLIRTIVAAAIGCWCTAVVGLMGWTLYEVNDQGKRIEGMSARITVMTQFMIPAPGRRAEVER